MAYLFSVDSFGYITDRLKVRLTISLAYYSLEISTMRIIDLDAEFLTDAKDIENRQTFKICKTLDGAQGLIMQCPGCAKGKPVVEEDGERFVIGVHSIICWFSNPKNAPKVPETMTPLPGRWEVSGDSLDNLTLNPSVWIKDGCGWHGWIKNGDAE